MRRNWLKLRASVAPLVAGALLLAPYGDAEAASSTSTINISLQVITGCGVSVPASLDWGSHLASGAMPGPLTGTVTVTCTSFSLYNLGFVGANDLDATGQNKQMKGAKPTNADTIKYNLSIGGAKIGKQDWTNTQTGFMFGAGSTSYTVTATLTTWTGASGGALTQDTYSDVVTARVDF